jgi:hypothetical protein
MKKTRNKKSCDAVPLMTTGVVNTTTLKYCMLGIKDEGDVEAAQTAGLQQ